MEREYISVVDTAKMIRTALKKAFPGVKFSVVSDKYAGGASIDVRYLDGPLAKDVEAVVGPFAGSGFDGMIDLKYSKSSFLLPNGDVVYGGTEGTAGSAGVVSKEAPELPEGAKVVMFMSDYVFVRRRNSAPAVKAALEHVAKAMGYPEWANLEIEAGYDSAYVKDGQKHFLNGAAGSDHWSVDQLVRRHLAGNPL